ncbi:MAG: sigma-54-dependent Fis family transcriptional regulator, partial [Mailhella sp.]|nr:sigma-54-dependent Fis family transcriptional regulator [Mailhella sp.]
DEGYEVTCINDPETALTFLEDSEIDVVITDMKMPKITGKELLQRIKKSWPGIPVIMMTAFGSIESAVEIMRMGAFDYVTKPFSNEDLILTLRNATELSAAHRQYRILQENLEDRYGKHQIIGKSRAIRDVLAIVDKVSASRTAVLISGETGTGKELVAKAIHFSSPRKDSPFVSVNCNTPGDSLEAELFGQEQTVLSGAQGTRRGRLEMANGGTLFLNEVGALPMDIQIKLLRVLQERSFERMGGTEPVSVDVRIVAATHKDLGELVRDGKFREDLYYRLNVVQILMPSLRERREDIPLLVSHFIQKISSENGIAPKTFTHEAQNYLSCYEWPGNIRQLQNIIERCMVMVGSSEIAVDDLPADIRDEEAQFKSAVDLLPVELNLADTLDKIEAALVRRALVRADFIQAKAAELLGISRSLMQYKLRKYNITGHGY